MTDEELLAGAIVPGPMTAELLALWRTYVAEIRDREAWVAENGPTIVFRDDKGDVRSVVEAPKYRQLCALRRDLTRLSQVIGVPALRLAVEEKPKARGIDDLKAKRDAKGRGATSNAFANA